MGNLGFPHPPPPPQRTKTITKVPQHTILVFADTYENGRRISQQGVLQKQVARIFFCTLHRREPNAQDYFPPLPPLQKNPV